MQNVLEREASQGWMRAMYASFEENERCLSRADPFSAGWCIMLLGSEEDYSMGAVIGNIRVAGN